MTISFNANEHEPIYDSSKKEVLPAGQYNVKVTGAEIKDTKAGNGKYVQITFAVTNEEFAGVELTERYNVQNANPKATQIGLGKLSALSRSLCASATSAKEQQKIMIVNNGNFSPWLGLPVKLTVDVSEGKPYIDKEGNPQPGQPQNEVRRVDPATAGANKAAQVKKVAKAAPVVVNEEIEEDLEEGIEEEELEEVETVPEKAPAPKKAAAKVATPDW
jgi:hypothetical protein